MFLTRVLLKQAKSKYVAFEFVMVRMTSKGTGHHKNWIRERIDDKREMVFFDPIVQTNCVYVETKRVRSMKPKKF